MKKILIFIFSGLFWSTLSLADCVKKPVAMTEETPCTWNQIISGKTKNCAVQKNYYAYAITCEYEKYVKRYGDLSFEETKKILEVAYLKKRKKEGVIQRKKEAEYNCSVVAGKANNSFSARQIYQKCLAYKGYN